MEKLNLFNVKKDDLSEYENECFVQIKKDPEVYGLLLNNGFEDATIKKYIGSCHTFYDDYYKWKKIKTFDDVVNSGIRYIYTLKLKDGIISRERGIIPPYQEYIDYQSKYIYKDFDDSFDSVSLKNIDNKELISKLKKPLKEESWIYLYGAIRSGRTYCSIALINSSAKRGSSGLAFIDSATRFKELSDLFFNDKVGFNRMLDSLKNAYLLVIDGFGNEYINDIVRDSVVIPLLQYRASNKKMTIFTSDFSLNDLITLYAKRDKSGNNIREKQLANILHSMIKDEIYTGYTSLY
ncbi:MAG: hypothetical protein WCS51_03660 [Bacilli bacterium]|jgi:primosomal protein DnaI